MTGANTVLNYTIVPKPVHVGGNPQDLTIIATLKSTAEFGQTLTSATIEKIEINFGSVSGNGNSLTDTDNAITAADFSPNDNWAVKDVSTNVVEVKPNGGGQISDGAIVLTVLGVQVNAAAGSVAITFTETVSAINGSTALPPPLEKKNVASVNLAKVENESTTSGTFSSNKLYIDSGDKITLTWDVTGSSDTISLHYIINNEFVHSVDPTTMDPYPGITVHADRTNKLKAKDHYPNTDYGDKPDVLKLYDTTVFILAVKSGTTTSYLTTTVIVEDRVLYAKTANIGDKSLDSTTTLDLTGHMSIGDNGDNGVFYIPNQAKGKFYFRKGDDSNYKDLARISHNGNVDLTGHMSIGDGLDNGVIYIPNQSKGKFFFRSGDDKSYKDLAQLSHDGNLNVGGNITASGFINRTSNYITSANLTEVGGWGGSTAKWPNGSVSSSGGKSVGTTEGFSTTNGAGNFGYYMVDLKSPIEAMLTADISIANFATGGGQGLWQIIASEESFSNNNNKFDNDKTMQVWSSQQDPSSGQIYDHFMFRIRPHVRFYGQYIYIAATDLNHGSLGLKINSIKVIPLQ